MNPYMVRQNRNQTTTPSNPISQTQSYQNFNMVKHPPEQNVFGQRDEQRNFGDSESLNQTGQENIPTVNQRNSK